MESRLTHPRRCTSASGLMETLSRCNEEFTLIKERAIWHTGPFMKLLMSFLASECTSTGMCTHINRPEQCHSSAVMSPSLFGMQRHVFQSAEAPNLIISTCLTDIRCTRTTIRFLCFCFQVLEVEKVLWTDVTSVSSKKFRPSSIYENGKPNTGLRIYMTAVCNFHILFVHWPFGEDSSRTGT